MSHEVIKVHGIGKRFKKSNRTQIDTFRDLIAESALRLVGRQANGQGDRPRTDEDDFVWALRDVSFSVETGEVLGIIGRNGAGKTTLLKILSRITAPTEGYAEIDGRASSLLEVGTGFHPELTGRENIYFNGTILGMGRRELDRRFADIVAFAGVSEFLDMPVKRYSAGMYTRLAFSVSAHLEPEIMIVDEVLSVGDAEFQERCLGKMRDVSRSGRTVLFVSHNMNAVRQLCSRVIWLDRGRIVADSARVDGVIKTYLFGDGSERLAIWEGTREGVLDNEHFRLERFFIGDEAGNPKPEAISNDGCHYVHIDVLIRRTNPLLNFGYAVVDENGMHVYWTMTTDTAQRDWPKLAPGRLILRAPLPPRFLNEGRYGIDFIASLHARGWLSEPGATPARLILRIQGGLSDSPYWRDPRPGVVAPVLPWQVLTTQDG